MAPIKRLVLDVLKPNQVTTIEFTEEVAALTGIMGANAKLLESDTEVQNLKVTIEGPAIDDQAVMDTIAALSSTVHSVDEAACGERLVEESATLQD